MQANTTVSRRVVVNADDFGFSPEVTAGILRAHREGIVTSTTLATNMPAAADAADALAQAPELGVGIHLNACQGPTLSSAGRRLTGPDGVMDAKAPKVILRCMTNPTLLRAIYAEFDAQIRWALDNGLRLTHLDSHRHVHAYTPIFRRVVALAKRYDIPAVRFVRERLPRADWPGAPAGQWKVRWLVNRFAWLDKRCAGTLRLTSGTWGIEHTGRIDRDWLIQASAVLPPGTTEIMTHPGLSASTPGDAQTRLTDSRPAELDALCDPLVRKAFDAAGIERVNYGQLRDSIKRV